MPKFSIIIPVLNEKDIIGTCIHHVRRTNPNVEIIVVDGGSQDDTCQAARETGATVLHSAKGRGRQCNRGAQHASGDVFLFLHADTRLPKDAFEQLSRFFKEDHIMVGTFRLRFNIDRGLLNCYSFFTRFDSVFTRFGDQGISVRKSFFNAIGGFPEWPLFEDVHFLRRAREQTKIHSFPGPVTTDARMFLKRGVIKQQLLNGYLIVQYLLGANPEKLYRRYYR